MSYSKKIIYNCGIKFLKNGIKFLKNGINFTMVNPSILDRAYWLLQGHIIENNQIIIYYLNNNGIMKEYKFTI